MPRVRIGWGQKDMTPRGGKIVIAGGVPLRTTDQVHDPLYAVAMVIDSAQSRTIWVSCDFCHPTPRVENEVIQQLRHRLPGFEDVQLIINGTHATACFYMTDDEFLNLDGEIGHIVDILPLEELRRQVCSAIVEAVLEAAAHTVECEMAFSSADILTGFCRRVVYKDGTAEMYGDVHRHDFLRMEYPDGGPTQALYFSDAKTHALTGIWVNVPCPSQADESSVHITADYWGVVRQRVRKELGENVKVLATCRAAGELSPHRMILSPDQDRNTEWGTAVAVRLGNWIADHVIAGYKAPLSRYDADSLVHGHITQELEFPVRMPTYKDYVRAKAFLQNPANFDESGRANDWMALSLSLHSIKLWENPVSLYRTKVTALRLGEVLFYTAPVELYAEYAHRIDMQFRDHPMFDVQLAHDYMGYLPTREAIDHGGYSTFLFSTVTGPNGGDYYVNQTAKLLRELL